MDRKEELEFMLKGAEVNVLYACKSVCENGIKAKASLDYAVESYKSINNSLKAYDEPEKLQEVSDSNAE